MAAQIRQEINILDHPLVSISTGTVSCKEKFYYDTTQYNGTVLEYLEVLAINNDVTNKTVSLTAGGTAPSVIIPASTSSYTLFRSSTSILTTLERNITIPDTTIAGQVVVKSARIIIIQNATTLTNTETQIEIGNYNLARTAEVATILVNPKYWKYDASKWDGTKTFYAEAVYDSGDMDTISVFIYESADILAPSWASVATIVSAAETTVATRTRVAFTPVDGRWYTIFSLNGSMDNHDIYRAGVVVQQGAIDSFVGTRNASRTVQGGTANSNEAAGQSFLTTSAYSVDAVSLLLLKEGTPTDNLTLEILSTSITGTVLATSDSVNGSSLSSGAYEWITFTFSSPPSLSDATTYYLRLTRSGANDTTNYYFWAADSGSAYSGGGAYIRNINSWSSESTTTDAFFRLFSSTLTKLEPQYLLANTLFAAGTALQTFLTDWDSTEWTGVTNAYYFQAEAANGSTSDVELWEADGGGAGLGVLTNIDNAQISSAVTMPADQNMDTKATTNAGDVAAARIFVAVSVDAAVEAGDTTKSFPYTRRTSPGVYSPGPAHYFERLKNALRRLLPI